MSRLHRACIETGNVTRGWLGVQIQNLDADLAAALGVDEGAGVLVADVFEGGPAAQAGLQDGDVMTAFDSQPVDSVRELSSLVAARDPDAQVEVAILRDGEPQTLEVRLGNRREAPQVAAANGAARPGAPGADAARSLGLQLAPLNARTRAEFGVPSDVQGALIASVEPQSPAAEKGLRRGDVILEVNQMAVGTVNETVAALRSARRNDERALLLIHRDGA